MTRDDERKRFSEALAAYSPKPGHRRLIESAVVHMDILGFGAMSASANAAAYLDEVAPALEAARESAMTEYPAGIHARAWFTDNVAIAFPVELVGDPAIAVSLAEMMAARLQMEMAMRGFLFSGGIALGPAYLEEGFVFGRAIVEAVKVEDLEREKSGGLLPRVLLTESAAAQQSAGKAGFRAALQRVGAAIDSDSFGDLELRRRDERLTFVSHLDWMMLEHRSLGWGEEALVYRLELHRDCILTSLQGVETSDRAKEKYRWLGRYHDAFCAKHFGPSSSLILGLG